MIYEPDDPKLPSVSVHTPLSDRELTNFDHRDVDKRFTTPMTLALQQELARVISEKK